MKSSKNAIDDFSSHEEAIKIDDEKSQVAVEVTKQQETLIKHSNEENVFLTTRDESSSFNDVAEDFVSSVKHADQSKKLSNNFEAMITTVDNPYDPFDQFDDWFRFDEEKGYHTCSYLGRVTRTSDEMSDEEFQNAIEQAIDQIIKYDFMNIYKKVKRPVQDE